MRSKRLVSFAIAAALVVAGSAAAISLRNAHPSEAANSLTVLYLTTEPLSSHISNSALTHSQVAVALGAITPKTWQEATTILDARHVDAIVIDRSALYQADPSRLQRAYAAGVPIASINMPADDLASLVNDPCISRDAFGQSSATSSRAFYIFVYRRITASDPSDAAALLASEQQHCGDEPPLGIRGEAHIARGRSVRDFAEGGPQTLLDLIKSSIRELATPQP